MTPPRSKAGATGTNPGKAGPKGALDLPDAHRLKSGRAVDGNQQRNFVRLSKAERKKSRRDGTN